MPSPDVWARATRLFLSIGAFFSYCCALQNRGLAIELTNQPTDEIKAQFLYNCSKLVTWPTNAFASRTAPFVIGVLGRDTLTSSLDQTLAGRKSAGRPLVAKHFDTIDSVTNCQILFVSKSERHNYATIVAALKGQPILTVGRTDGFAKWGVIEFQYVDGHVSPRINLAAASEANLKISSHLAKLDRNIKSAVRKQHRRLTRKHK